LSITKRLPLALLLTPLVLAGCAKDNDITAIGGSIGQQVQRTNCPAVGIPAYTGDVTLFNPAGSRDARAIDLVANITDLRSTCDEANEAAANLTTTVNFRVDARRSDPHGARDVVLPYFAVVMHGGTDVASKSISRVSVHFDDGKLLASSTGQATAAVARADATLPDAVRAKLNRKRKSSDEDASVDPMTDPQVRAALGKASFEVLVGFQLSQQDLAYNATR
jgi:hypothetical protein